MLNQIIISGRVVRDPELRKTNSGMSVCTVTVAVDRMKDKNGDKITDFFTANMYGKTADAFSQYVSKGQFVEITGKMHSNTYEDKDGKKKTYWGIDCDKVDWFNLAPKKKEEEKVVATDDDLPF